MSGRHEEPVRERTGLSPERVAEAERVVTRVTRWAAGRGDLVGVLLVGSYARGAARADSDIDFVVLTEDRTSYSGSGWADELALGDPVGSKSWGPVEEQRFVTASGLEVDVCIGSPEWAGTRPVDSGTHRVVADGARALHDPTGVLASLIEACRS
ncbi:nucleotidyltransferase domain-containing protein [Streptomyces sp. Act-28]